jgi:hypothetical protein
MLYHTKLDFDYGLFLGEYERLKSYEYSISHPNGTEFINGTATNDYWTSEGKYMIHAGPTMTSTVLSEYCNEIKRMFMLPGRVDGRFYRTEPNITLPPHVDGSASRPERTQCSLNFIINDNNGEVTFYDKGKETSYTYKQALLDVTQVHSVKNNDNTDRILFRISIFHVCFDEVKEIMDHHGFLEK